MDWESISVDCDEYKMVDQGGNLNKGIDTGHELRETKKSFDFKH